MHHSRARRGAGTGGSSLNSGLTDKKPAEHQGAGEKSQFVQAAISSNLNMGAYKEIGMKINIEYSKLFQIFLNVHK